MQKIHFKGKRLRSITSLKLLMNTEITYCIDDVIVKSQLLKKDYNEKYLHEIRISLRKIISLINFFKDLIKKNQTKKVKKNLHNLIAPTSKVRDYDVTMTNYIYPEFEDSITDNDNQQYKKKYIAEIGTLHDNLSTSLSSQDYEHKLIELKHWAIEYNWDDVLKDIPKRSLPDYIKSLINIRFNQLMYHNKHLMERSNKELHHQRIKIKELRYIIEIFKFYIKNHKGVLTKLKSLQDILGEINDTYAAESIINGLNILKDAPARHQNINKHILSHRKSRLKILKKKI